MLHHTIIDNIPPYGYGTNHVSAYVSTERQINGPTLVLRLKKSIFWYSVVRE